METLILGLLLGSLYGLLAVGIVLVYKATRVLNFAQGEFGTFATYLAWLLIVKARVPWLLGALLALTAIGLLGFVVERVVIRPMLEGPKLAIAVATLGIMSLLGFVEAKVWGFSPQILPPPVAGRGPLLFGIYVPPMRIAALVAAALVGAGLWWFVKRTTFGLGLLASAQDPQAVRLMGIRLRHLSSFTWVAAAVLGGLAGILVLSSLGTFHPFAMTPLFVPALAAALLGGMTSIPGSFAGGIMVGLLDAALRQNLGTVSGIREAGVFAVLIAVLLFRPRGLFGKAA